jgi:hypothetical protein
MNWPALPERIDGGKRAATLPREGLMPAAELIGVVAESKFNLCEGNSAGKTTTQRRARP